MLTLALLTILPVAGCECRNEGGARAGIAPLEVDAGADPCPHPWFPLVEGGRWSYEITTGPDSPPSKADLRVIAVAAKGRSLTSKVRKSIGARETVVEAFCNAEGVSFLPLFVELAPPLPISLNYVPTVTKRVNALLPPISKLSPGAQWSHSVEAHTEQPGGVALTLDSQWDVEVANLGDEEVTVPAGTYQVKQLKLVVTGHHRPPAEKEVVFSERIADPPGMTFTYSFAKGVGVVLIEAEPLADRPAIQPRWALSEVALER